MRQDPPDSPQSIYRREARSGRVSYGDPVILHDTSRSRVAFVPFFVPRTEGTDLSVKIVTYKKNPPPADWVVLEDKSLSLDEMAARRLLVALRDHLVVAEENTDGQYILIRVDEGTAKLGDNDPASVAAALTKVLSQEEIVEHLAHTQQFPLMARSPQTSASRREF